MSKHSYTLASSTYLGSLARRYSGSSGPEFRGGCARGFLELVVEGRLGIETRFQANIQDVQFARLVQQHFLRALNPEPVYQLEKATSTVMVNDR